ncbi:MAG: uroporphyrinogen decarboxylase family protein [Phycisphaerae bacterium]
MPTELAKGSWRLAPLEADAYGPYGDFPRPTDQEKNRTWQDYQSGRPQRVPVNVVTNNRVFLLDPRFDVEGLTYERVFAEPQAMLTTQLRWQYVCRLRYHLFCDQPTALPEKWEIGMDVQNVYEAAFFGAPVHYHANDVPDTRPVLDDENKQAIFDVDIDRPLAHGFFREATELSERIREFAKDKTFFGRPIVALPYAALGTDGPLTVAMNLRGPAILTDLIRDPDYARQLFDFLVTAAVKRYHVFRAHWDLPEQQEVWMADDSIAMLSTAQYEEFLLAYHCKWYDGVDPRRNKIRGMHLCGDATRHFKTIRDHAGVASFDTGFPVDFTALRRELGPDTEILGGVEVPTLLNGTPQQVYERAREILQSGITEGGRFVLRDANNLPPRVPWANLAAMCKAAFEFGVYER